MLKKYLLYLLRWQLSTPILFFVFSTFTIFNDIQKTILGNLIGGLIFFWIDLIIFHKGDEKNGYNFNERGTGQR